MINLLTSNPPMKPTIIPSLAAIMLASVITTSLHGTPLNGLTVALSPNNKTLVAAGSNRAFLRMDPATLEVKDRVWNGLSITQMAFNKDGTVLAATDGDGMVTLFDEEHFPTEQFPTLLFRSATLQMHQEDDRIIF